MWWRTLRRHTPTKRWRTLVTDRKEPLESEAAKTRGGTLKQCGNASSGGTLHQSGGARSSLTGENTWNLKQRKQEAAHSHNVVAHAQAAHFNKVVAHAHH